MKKAAVAIVVSLLCAHLALEAAYAVDSKLLQLRGRIFEGSQEIKALITPASKDAAVLTSLFDSCIVAVNQVDAYFSMLGLFEAVRKEDRTATTIDFLGNWLSQIKRTNDLNLKFLGSAPAAVEESTKAQIEKLRGYFSELNSWVEKEQVKLSVLRKALKAPQAPAKKR